MKYKFYLRDTKSPRNLEDSTVSENAAGSNPGQLRIRDWLPDALRKLPEPRTDVVHVCHNVPEPTKKNLKMYITNNKL